MIISKTVLIAILKKCIQYLVKWFVATKLKGNKATIRFKGFKPKKKGQLEVMIEFPDNSVIADVAIGYTKANGEPGTIDKTTPIAVFNTAEGVVVDQMVVSEDGSTVTFAIIPDDNIEGVAGVITITADVDLGDGVRNLPVDIAWTVPRIGAVSGSVSLVGFRPKN